jgi:uncharacterized membrane protein YGL010W
MAPKPLYPERFLSGLVFYGAYHTNPVNKAIHLACIPAIYGSALVLLHQIPLRVPTIISSALAAAALPSASVALPFAAFYAAYWSYLTGPSILGVSASALAFGSLWGVGAWGRALGVRALPIAAGIQVCSWLAQFYGHGVHEKRSPALLDNLFSALVLAPLFVYTEVLMGLGLASSLHDAIDTRVQKAVAEFRENKKA